MKIIYILMVMVFGGCGYAVTAAPLEFFLNEQSTYEPSVPKPDAFLGHEIGSQPIRHDQMVAYIEALAEASPRLAVETIGYSHEGRPILFVVATSPENHAELDEIKANHLELQDEPDGPVITWLNYGVHGAESSGMDAAVPLLYHLAAATDAATLQQLSQSVILVTAVFNPDGHSRRIAWQMQNASSRPVINRDDAIHREPWPGGRSNHYGFDLNRQWLLQTQPESKAWLRKWHEWKPHVSADFHEMGPEASYYFHPGVPGRTHSLVPPGSEKLMKDLSIFHADALDAAGKLYYSEESFDNFYVGKGSTYPHLNGAVGILFEAGGQAGIAFETAQGVKTFAGNIQSQVMTSFSTIKGAVALQKDLKAHQKQFYRKASVRARQDPVKAYVFRAPEDPVRVDMFIKMLRAHQISVYELAGALKAEGTSFDAASSYLVPLDQPQYTMIKAVFDRQTSFSDAVFYDVSGWTLPLAYGLEYAEVTASVSKVSGVPVNSVPDQFRSVGDASYGYIFRWSDYYAPRVLNGLLQAGVFARVLKEPVTVQTTEGKQDFSRGAIFVPSSQTLPRADLRQLINDLAKEASIRVYGAVSGLTVNPGADLGGRLSAHDLAAPKPLLVIGEGVSVYDAGEVWHLLDYRMQMPLARVDKARLHKVRLYEYSHIILVGGSGSRLSEEMEDQLEDWVRSGGTLIALRHGAKWVASQLLDKNPASALKVPTQAGRAVYAHKAQRDARHVIGGAVFESTLDLTHPMAFGLARRRIATNRRGTVVLPRPKDVYTRVAVYSSQPLLSGYASTEWLAALADTPMMTAQRMGDGAIILFADNPNFRATYPAAEKLFLNAFFFSKAFEKARKHGDESMMELE